jgi:uncharacterized protein YndB with AHSA1/START domain
MIKSLLLAAVLACLTPAAAVAASAYPDVTDTSTIDAAGSRVIQLSIVLLAKPKAVWDAFADAPTVRRWSAPLVAIDLRQGGSLEESYSATAKLGDAQNIRHQIVAYVPGQTLVFRNTNAPTGLPGHEVYSQVVTILQVDDLGAGKTRLTLSQTGFDKTPAFDSLYRFFHEENAALMETLKSALEKPGGALHVAR